MHLFLCNFLAPNGPWLWVAAGLRTNLLVGQASAVMRVTGKNLQMAEVVVGGSFHLETHAGLVVKQHRPKQILS